MFGGCGVNSKAPLLAGDNSKAPQPVLFRPLCVHVRGACGGWMRVHRVGVQLQPALPKGGWPDFITDPWLLAYNCLATHAMSVAGLPAIDAHDVIAPLADLTCDGSHFIGLEGMIINQDTGGRDRAQHNLAAAAGARTPTAYGEEGDAAAVCRRLSHQRRRRQQ